MAQDRKRGGLVAEAKGIAAIIVAVLLFHSLIAKPFYIPSGSMLPNLWIGDRLIVSKWPYGWSYVSPSFHVLPFIKGRLFGKMPKRGDIVIVKPPGSNADYIKRVIGLPGDSIGVQDGVLWLNGSPVPRRPLPPANLPISPNMPCNDVRYDRYRETLPSGDQVCAVPRFRETLPGGTSYDVLDLGISPEDDYPPIIVPEGHLFLMGDNRDDSADSRIDPLEGGLGLVAVENIGGRAEFITFSVDGSSRLSSPASWFSAIRHGRIGISLHPERE